LAKIHSTALVETKDIGENTNIWAFAHLMEGVKIGAGCNVGDHVFIETGCRIGNNVTIKNQVLLWDGVVVEDDVFIGPRVTFTNDRYPRSSRMEEAKIRYARREAWLLETLVRRGCSIGAGAVICPGIELGRYCVIGAGAVVTRSVPDFALVVGNPAKHIADVCICGKPLSSSWQTAECEQCGQTGCMRDQY
jgi:UDP-2-acetamido-3-amino-2,3-dideoxy-glucuronate N-acetyltransferase